MCSAFPVGPLGAGLRIAQRAAPAVTEKLVQRLPWAQGGGTIQEAEKLAKLLDVTTVYPGMAAYKVAASDTGTWEEQQQQQYKFNEFQRHVRGLPSMPSKEFDPDGTLANGWRARWSKEFPNVKDEWKATQTTAKQLELVREHLVLDADLDPFPAFQHKDAYKEMGKNELHIADKTKWLGDLQAERLTAGPKYRLTTPVLGNNSRPASPPAPSGLGIKQGGDSSK